MPPRYSIFIGTFVHSKKLDEIEIIHNRAVVVNPEGRITYAGPQKEPVNGYPGVLSDADVAVYRSKEGQFFFPGFIGQLKACLQLLSVPGSCRLSQMSRLTLF